MIKHLAMMMDGNRRWAKKQGLAVWLGHRQGVESVKRAMEFCLSKKIPYLSIYTFSLENFKRSEQETSYVFNLLATELENQLSLFLENDVCIRFVGDRLLFPQSVIKTINNVEEKTAHCTALTVNALFCYGAQQEIVDGVKEIVRRAKLVEISEYDIRPETFNNYLWMRGIPEPELVIRTGGAQRLSNFLLYQSAYSEFCFLDCLWPELTTQHLDKVMDDFVARKRNFGA
jgi:undecaprenyl diphosphate synthase